MLHNIKTENSDKAQVIRVGLAAHQLQVEIMEGQNPHLGYYPLGSGIFKTGFVFVYPDRRVEEVIAFDNRTGDNFMETFSDVNEAFAWLKGSESTPVQPKAHHIKETCINPCCLDDACQDTDLMMFGIVDDSLFIVMTAAMTVLLVSAVASVFGWGL